MNPHGFRRHPLKMVCLPVPPLPHSSLLSQIRDNLLSSTSEKAISCGRARLTGNLRTVQGHDSQDHSRRLLTLTRWGSLRLLSRSLLLLLWSGARNAGCRWRTLGGSPLCLSLNPAGVTGHTAATRGEETQHQAAYEERDCEPRGRSGQKGRCSPTSEDGAGDTRSSEGSGQTFAFRGLHENRDNQADAD